ncbi:MAG: N-acetylmuramoyl-L-alanine amidase [Clostridia bacterium]|nr:N-acetylmuramoyl-L-alanine amidase [Clostridia bacterium]
MILNFKINLKQILCYLCIFTLLFGSNAYISYSNKAISTSTPLPRFTVVLDPGHGGIDSGCVGSLGIYERDINLCIAQKLGDFLKTLGIKVVLTRTNQDGLYGTFASGHKKRDMKAREEIIKKANPNLVVSIHLNSYSSPSPHGAQVFYKLNNDISRELGQALQDMFVEQVEGSRKNSMPGDFYILNCTKSAGILVECGFLSNPEEEAKLVTPEYQEKIAYTIMCGVVEYFGLAES